MIVLCQLKVCSIMHLLGYNLAWSFKAKHADNNVSNGTVFLSKSLHCRGGAKESDRSNLSTVELLIK